MSRPSIMSPLRRLRWFAHLVLACLCLAALAPTVTRLLQSAAGVPVWQVVCRSTGEHQAVQLLRVDVAGQGKPQVVQVDHDDCPMCAVHHQAWLPPSSGVPSLPSARSHPDWPPLFLRAPRPLFAWSTPWSTGPPRQL